MTNRSRVCRVMWGTVLLGGLLWAGCARAASPQFTADCQALTKTQHRLAGSPEYQAAADYVVQRLRAIGLETVIIQQFPTIRSTVKQCDLTLAVVSNQATISLSLPLLPIRPNGIIHPVTPPDGLQGKLFYAGNGTASEYGPNSPQGKIIVLNYNSNANWLWAFKMGAVAVIFVGQEPAEFCQSHYVDAQANFPRFYYAGSLKDLPDGADAVIRSTVIWEQAMGANIFGLIPGTDAKFELGQKEAVILSANLDSFGEVPQLSPGARGAANCAALLRVAEWMTKNRPRRDLVLAFFDAQANGHEGVSAFYRALYQEPRIDAETKFVDAMLDCLQDPDKLTPDSPVFNEAIQRLKIKATDHVDAINAKLEDWRYAIAGLKKRTTSAQPTAASEITRLEKQIDAQKTVKFQWNELRRALGHKNIALARQEPLMELFTTIMAEVLADVTVRQKELMNLAGALKSNEAIRNILGNAWINLHSTLLLGDISPRWGLVIGGQSAFHNVEDQIGLYGKIQAVFLAAYNEMRTAGRPITHFETTTADGTGDAALFWAPYLIHSGEIAGRHGIYNLAFGTGQDPLQREGTPDDTLDRLNLDIIETQADEVAVLLGTAMNMEGLSVRRSIVPDAYYTFPDVDAQGRSSGLCLVGITQSSSMPNTPMPHAVYRLFQPNLALIYSASAADTYSTFQPPRIPAFNDYQVIMTDANGGYGFGPVRRGVYVASGFAALFNERGEVMAVCAGNEWFRPTQRIYLFPCASTSFDAQGRRIVTPRYGAVVMPLQPETIASKVMVDFMKVMASSLLDPTKSYYDVRDGVALWYCERRDTAIKFFGLRAAAGLVTGDEAPGTPWNTRDVTVGRGFAMTNTFWSFPDMPIRSAADIWRLDEHRMENLRSKGVMNSSLEELHGRAEDLWIAASRTNRLALQEALATSAFMSECPTYKAILDSLDDLVRAVLILLGLAIPFAFALERLIIGSVNIYRQISWFCLFFTLTFLVLYYVHPAFAVSAQPIIIFLAFALMLLSSVVIFIMMQKFEQEIKSLQGLTSTVHSADVSRFSTMMAAVVMGISTMRRRPLRTGLTAFTIILLTFTILNFASFAGKLGLVNLFKGAVPAYAGILVHDVEWKPLNPALVDLFRGRWGEKAVVTSRYWKDSVLVMRADGRKNSKVDGVLGVDDAELSARADWSQVTGGLHMSLTNAVLMTKTLANHLGVQIGDEVMVGGCRLRVAALLNSADFTSLMDMDGSSVLPVDFTAGSEKQQRQGEDRQAGENLLAAVKSSQEWTVLLADSVLVVSSETARQIHGVLRVITVYTPDTESATLIAEDMARTFPVPVVATRAAGVYTHVLAPTVKAQGIKDLLFPFLLGGLVIFGTLLGSVADREKEIYTFSALGLAPPHVATLFFAEAMVYSCIGGVGGYLLAQILLKVLTFLQSFGLVTVPDMNYSSFNAIMTIVIVMVVVLASAIYPAYKASRSANPGILRTWRLPAPDGDRFHIMFPFTVSQYDITGVISFLKEHFDNFSDTSLGMFMTKDTQIAREGPSLALQSSITLAPFDLGVTQEFHLCSVPSEISGIDEVKIEIVRKSGQKGDWARLNKTLLNDLRRQFLIWRSLPHETMDMYRHRTLAAMESGEKIPPSSHGVDSAATS